MLINTHRMIRIESKCCLAGGLRSRGRALRPSYCVVSSREGDHGMTGSAVSFKCGTLRFIIIVLPAPNRSYRGEIMLVDNHRKFCQ